MRDMLLDMGEELREGQLLRERELLRERQLREERGLGNEQTVEGGKGEIAVTEGTDEQHRQGAEREAHVFGGAEPDAFGDHLYAKFPR